MPNAPSAPLRPCDMFDFIVGISTGGISALFVGRLHMAVDQAIEKYFQMASTVFKSPSLWLRRFLRWAPELPSTEYLWPIASLCGKYCCQYPRDPVALLLTPAILSAESLCLRQQAASPYDLRIALAMPGSLTWDWPHLRWPTCSLLCHSAIPVPVVREHMMCL